MSKLYTRVIQRSKFVGTISRKVAADAVREVMQDMASRKSGEKQISAKAKTKR